MGAEIQEKAYTGPHVKWL